MDINSELERWIEKQQRGYAQDLGDYANTIVLSDEEGDPHCVLWVATPFADTDGYKDDGEIERMRADALTRYLVHYLLVDDPWPEHAELLLELRVRDQLPEPKARLRAVEEFLARHTATPSVDYVVACLPVSRANA